MGKSVIETAPRGCEIRCARCDGHGIVTSWSNIPDECPDCGGSGRNWQYPGGAIARYYSGPLLSGPGGRLATVHRNARSAR